ALRVSELVHPVFAPESACQIELRQDSLAYPFGVIAACGVKAHQKCAIPSASRLASSVVGAVHDRPISVEQATQKMRKHYVRDANCAERKGLPRSQTNRLEPPVETDVADLNTQPVVAEASLDRAYLRRPVDATEECLEYYPFGRAHRHVSAARGKISVSRDQPNRVGDLGSPDPIMPPPQAIRTTRFTATRLGHASNARVCLRRKPFRPTLAHMRIYA